MPHRGHDGTDRDAGRGKGRTHQHASHHAEKRVSEGTKQRGVAKVGSVGVALVALVEDLVCGVAKAEAHGQDRVGCGRLDGGPVMQQH